VPATGLSSAISSISFSPVEHSTDRADDRSQQFLRRLAADSEADEAGIDRIAPKGAALCRCVYATEGSCRLNQWAIIDEPIRRRLRLQG
jgi:hypothetical protein